MRRQQRAVSRATGIDVSRCCQFSSAGSNADDTSVPLPPLRCPGGPRMSAMGIKSLLNVPNAGYLAKYDQRFILNLKLTHQIMAHLTKTVNTSDKLLVELGPGAGALTRSLLTRPSVGVLGIEVDARFNPMLEQIKRQTSGKFQWKNGDILELDEFEVVREMFPSFAKQHERTPRMANVRGEAHSGLRNLKRDDALRSRLAKQQHASSSSRDGNKASSSRRPDEKEIAAKDAPEELLWWSGGDAKLEVVGNLPFSIVTELLMRYAVDCSKQQGLYRFGRVPVHVFVQKEVAERMTASPGSHHFSRLSVLSQNYFRVAVRQTFTELTYYPRTEVLGCLVTLVPRVAPLVNVDAATLIRFNDIIMKPGMRNTMMIKALNRSVPQEVALFMLQELRLDGSVLPAQLSTLEVAKLALLWQRFLEATHQSGSQTGTPGSDEPLRNREDKESAAVNFDWEKEERYAVRQRDKMKSSAKR